MHHHMPPVTYYSLKPGELCSHFLCIVLIFLLDFQYIYTIPRSQIYAILLHYFKLRSTDTVISGVLVDIRILHSLGQSDFR